MAIHFLSYGDPGGIIHTWSEPQSIGRGAAMSYSILNVAAAGASEISVEQRVKSQANHRFH